MGHPVSLPLAGWSLCAPSEAAIDTRHLQIDPLLSRRLSRLSRMALVAASGCVRIQKSPPVNTVFASRHGEVVSTMKMLHCLSQRTPLSPAAFSLSVHSAAAGLLSVLRADHSSFTSVSAGMDTLFAALQEAAGQLAQDPSLSLLVLYADEVLPEELGRFRGQTDTPHALALLFTASAARKELRIEQDAPTGTNSTSQPAIALAEVLELGGKAFQWNSPRHSWKITLHEQAQ